MASAKHRERVTHQSVKRAEAFFGRAVQAVGPQMAADGVVVFPLLPQRIEMAEKQIRPARFPGAFVEKNRLQHGACAAPCEPAHVANFFLLKVSRRCSKSSEGASFHSTMRIPASPNRYEACSAPM